MYVPQFFSHLQSSTMRCLIAICLASVVGLSTANYGGYQLMNSYLPYGNHQHMYVPQHQPVIKLDMDFSPSVTYPAHHGSAGGSTQQPGFGSRSGSVTTTACLESEGLAKDALKANLKNLKPLPLLNWILIP